MAREDAGRHPGNADGDWSVDRRCIDCGAARHVAAGLIVHRDGQSVFARQPATAEETHAAWLAAELCPTRSVRTESHLRPPEGLYPHDLGDGVWLCGHNARASFGAHAYFMARADGNVMVDSPVFTRKLVGAFEARGGLARILLSHRDDVADADKYAAHFGAEVVIHTADWRAAPYATRLLEGDAPSAATQVAEGIVALPVPGHTRGSVVYLVDDTLLFTGDSLCWSLERGALHAFRDVCWYSWPAQTASLAGLLDLRFERVLSGHGSWSPRMPADVMRRHLAELTEWMGRTP